MTNTTSALLDTITELLDGYDGTVFRTSDNGTVVTADDDDALLNLYRSAPSVPGSSHIHDDEHVSAKLGTGWSMVAHLRHEDTPASLRYPKIADAAQQVVGAPGVYAIESFLDGDEYALISMYLLRYDA